MGISQFIRYSIHWAFILRLTWLGKFFELFRSRSFFTDCHNYRRLHSRCHSRLQWFWFCNGSRYKYFACNSTSSRCASCPHSRGNGEHKSGAASLERHRLVFFTLVACRIASCYPLWGISACEHTGRANANIHFPAGAGCCNSIITRLGMEANAW